MGYQQSGALHLAEIREFASFEPSEQRFIKQALHLIRARDVTEVVAQYARNSDETYVIKAQHIFYSRLQSTLKLPAGSGYEASGEFLGILIPVTAFDLAQEKVHSFSAYRFLYERILGAEVRPWLPSAFCAAAALPQIRPQRRKLLLQSISEAAATAPGWSQRQPSFIPEWIEREDAS